MLNREYNFTSVYACDDKIVATYRRICVWP